ITPGAFCSPASATAFQAIFVAHMPYLIAHKLTSVSRLMQAARFFLCFCGKVPLKIVRQTSTKVKKYGDSQENGTDLHGGMRCVWPARRNGWTACPSLR